MKKLLIYVPTYNSQSRLPKFLHRFKDESYGIKEYVSLHVNDNCSANFLEVTKCENDNIAFTRNNSNLGLSRNFNKVFDYNQDYEYTWILGDDDYLTVGSIRRALKILDNEKPDFLFCNTITYSDDIRGEVLTHFENNNKQLPHGKGIIKSSFCSETVTTEFCKLLHPLVDEVLLGSIMCGIFKTKSVKDYSSSDLPETNDLTVQSAYPHVINYARSFSPESKAVYDPFVYTFNFWSGGNTWRDQYHVVVALGLLYSIQCYSENHHLDDAQEKMLIQHYLRIAHGSLNHLYSDSSAEIRAQFSVVAPYLFSRLSAFELDGRLHTPCNLFRIKKAVLRRFFKPNPCKAVFED